MSIITSFASDYLEGAHENIINKLLKVNMDKSDSYGSDEYCHSAIEKIQKACECQAEVHFLVGGTQANITVIDSLLRPYEGVIAANTGHINCHEAGGIEHGGHKVLTIPHEDGKISPAALKKYMKNFYGDGTWEHMVIPGMVYISHPTEYGTLYTLEELTALRAICDEYKLRLYVDGARMAYALGSPANDITLADFARLTDVFYIGGTKCGALIGEAVVIPKAGSIPHFFTMMKQHGAVLAKGRNLGIQFDELFTDGLYYEIGATAMKAATKIKEILAKHNIPLFGDSPTNQIFAVLENEMLNKLMTKIGVSVWEPYDENHTVVRFAVNWATSDEHLEILDQVLTNL